MWQRRQRVNYIRIVHDIVHDKQYAFSYRTIL